MSNKMKSALQGRRPNNVWFEDIQIIEEAVDLQRQPFGSIPCRRNSALANSFNQLPRLIPSRVAAAFNCSRSSGAMRIWKVGDQPSPFWDLSLLIVDTYVRNLLVWLLLRTYVITADVIKATPRSAGTLPRRLTNTLRRLTLWLSRSVTKLTLNLYGVFTHASNPVTSSLLLTVNAKPVSSFLIHPASLLHACRFRRYIMREVIALKELLSKIETLAEAALYLDAQDEKVLQTELIMLISELAGNSASPVQGGEHA